MSKFLGILLFVFGAMVSSKCKNDASVTRSLRFDITKTADSTFYNLISRSPAEIEVEVMRKKNSLYQVRLKEFTLLQPYDTVPGVIRLPNVLLDKIDQETLLYEYLETKYFYGNSKTAKHNDNYTYALPYEMGKSYKISQTFNGKKSHYTTESKYAIDFVMPEGTKIYAARDGVVVYTIDHYKKSGGKEFTKMANKILVLHDDGTFASYSHLRYKGTVVQKGDRVTRGQHIGYSGNTGYSSGPHLHFAVRLPRDICVPVYFEGYEKKVLRKGKRYIRTK